MTQTEQQKREAQDRIDLIRSVLSTPHGRRFVFGLIRDNNKTGVLCAAYVPGDTHATAFNEGRRSIGHALMVEVYQCAPDLFLLACREHIEALEKGAKPKPQTETTDA